MSQQFHVGFVVFSSGRTLGSTLQVATLPVRLDGDADGKNDPLTLGALAGYGPLQQVRHQRVDDMHPQTAVIRPRLGGEKRFEDFFNNFPVHPFAIVAVDKNQLS